MLGSLRYNKEVNQNSRQFLSLLGWDIYLAIDSFKNESQRKIIQKARRRAGVMVVE